MTSADRPGAPPIGIIPPGGIPFVKGHGTENDFILLPDAAGELAAALAPTPAQVRALCDRRAGIGADGVIRIAPAAAGDEAAFVMDYRNADGSDAQMCGNGARVFARYLVDAGWSPPGRIAFRTRGGLRHADVPAAGDITVEMGAVTVGMPTTVRVGGAEFAAVAVDVGNPHAVCLTREPLAELDLTAAPTIDPAVFPDGANVEFVAIAVGGADRVRMRVHERGVGETRSCGTGAVAAAAAHLRSTGRDAGAVTVDVPGGTVEVVIDQRHPPVATVAPGASVATGSAGSRLRGPAELVAAGTITADFWRAHA